MLIHMEFISIRESVLDVEAILSNVAARLTVEPMDIAGAKANIEEARTILLDLAEAVDKTEQN